jgi:hypothetical protein
MFGSAIESIFAAEACQVVVFRRGRKRHALLAKWYTQEI